MMKVLLEMTKIGNRNSGLGQFCLHLGKALAGKRNQTFEPVFYVPKKETGAFGPSVSQLAAKYLHRFIPLRTNAAVWHSIHQDSPYLPGRNRKVILTIHDLNFLHTSKSAWRKRRMLSALQQRVNRVTVIVCISNYVAGEVKRHLSTGNRRVEVIYNGNCLDHDLVPRRPASVPSCRFLLSVGIISPKKNIHASITMLPLLDNDIHLVIAGSHQSAYVVTLLKLAKENGVQQRVHLTGAVSEAEKLWLYRNCEALMFPGISEGFGLPVVEAMSCGKPVFLSRLTSLPEIGGDEAFYFDDFAPLEMAGVVKKGLAGFSPDHAERLRRRASTFTWEEAAGKYIEIYKSLGPR